jgi:hypothetical protein
VGDPLRSLETMTSSTRSFSVPDGIGTNEPWN